MADDGGDVVAGAARIRDTAKWLTISLATVGGVLIAGSQLSDIGDLKPGTGRFAAAIVGASVAAVAVVIIMWLSILIATSRSITMLDLTRTGGRSVPVGLTNLLTDERFLNGRVDVSVLDDEYTRALTRRKAAYHDLDVVARGVRTKILEKLTYKHKLATDAQLRQPSMAGVREGLEHKLAALDSELQTATGERAVRVEAVNDANGSYVALNATVITLLDTATYRNLAYRWRRSGAVILLIGVIAAGGIGLFVWAANPPPAVQASAATPAVLTTPSQATVTLTDAGRAALRSALGAGCPISSPLAALELGATDAGADVLVQQPGCSATRFVAVPEWASVQNRP
jgi:hypothetical protein